MEKKFYNLLDTMADKLSRTWFGRLMEKLAQRVFLLMGNFGWFMIDNIFLPITRVLNWIGRTVTK